MTTPSNLTSGSIWARQKPNSDEYSYSLVLCVTNEGLPERVLEKNPQQVVFVTDQGKILSMCVEDFCHKRHYFTFDASFADSFEEIITTRDDDEVESDPAEEGQSSIDDVVADEKLFSAEQSVKDKAGCLALNVGPHPLAEVLQSSLVGYVESPFHTGDTLHTLKFELSDSLTINGIIRAFLVSDPNSIQKFELSTATETFQVEIDTFVCVLLESDQWSNYGCLYITSNGCFRSHPDVGFIAQEVQPAAMEHGAAAPDTSVIDLSVTAVDAGTATNVISIH